MCVGCISLLGRYLACAWWTCPRHLDCTSPLYAPPTDLTCQKILTDILFIFHPGQCFIVMHWMEMGKHLSEKFLKNATNVQQIRVTAFLACPDNWALISNKPTEAKPDPWKLFTTNRTQYCLTIATSIRFELKAFGTYNSTSPRKALMQHWRTDVGMHPLQLSWELRVQRGSKKRRGEECKT